MIQVEEDVDGSLAAANVNRLSAHHSGQRSEALLSI
jgi:hypothetical protein